MAKQIQLDTFDGKKLSVTVWDDVEKILGAVVVSHGMAEHIGRYARFAGALNAEGYVVLGDDHRGHRNNPCGEKGVVEGDSFEDTVEDIHTVVEYARRTYQTDVALVGHSYGSFLAQRYLEKYSDTITRCILSGTAYMKTPLTKFGAAFAKVQSVLVGGKKTGKLIDKLSFGSYNKPFEEQGQPFAWLSRDKEEVQKYMDDEYCGYPLCIDFYKNFLHGVTHNMYGSDSDNIRKDIPVLIAVGQDDPVSNRAVLAQQLYDFYTEKGLSNVHLKIYDGARHEILNETNRDEVTADFLAFLKD